MPAWVDDDRLARAAWSRVVEPTDRVGGRVAARLGPAEALRHVLAGTPLPLPARPDERPAAVRAALAEAAERWRVRAVHTDPRRDLDDGRAPPAAGCVVPADDEWPAALADLGDAGAELPVGAGHR